MHIFVLSTGTMGETPTPSQVHHVLESPSCNHVKNQSDAQNKWKMFSFQNLGTKPTPLQNYFKGLSNFSWKPDFCS